jgi:ATP phosphoribosyltransferase
MAIPNKGRLNERAVELLQKSGLDIGEDWGRRLYVTVKNQDIEVMFVRAQDIPEFINSGTIDLGITGLDQVAESGYAMENVLDLEFGFCRLSVAAPEASRIKCLDDIPSGCRIATSFPNITRKFMAERGKSVEVVTVSGAAEIMPYLGVSDIIVDLVSSGSTLKTNNLVEVETIVKSQAAVITTKAALKERGAEIDNVVNAISSVIAAEKMKYLMADIPRSKLPQVEKMLPGIGGPTVLDIAGRTDMVAIHVVISQDEVYEAVNGLKNIGGKGILILPIDRLVQ